MYSDLMCFLVTFESENRAILALRFTLIFHIIPHDTSSFALKYHKAIKYNIIFMSFISFATTWQLHSRTAEKRTDFFLRCRVCLFCCVVIVFLFSTSEININSTPEKKVNVIIWRVVESKLYFISYHNLAHRDTENESPEKGNIKNGKKARASSNECEEDDKSFATRVNFIYIYIIL